MFGALLDRRRWPYTSHDLDRFIAIVTTADRDLRKRWGIGLTVVSMWSGHPNADSVHARLRKAGVVVVPIESLIRDYPARWKRYHIPRDEHFNPLGNRALAAGLQRLLANR
jgi:Iap family predicted aminopeptidase